MKRKYFVVVFAHQFSLCHFDLFLLFPLCCVHVVLLFLLNINSFCFLNFQNLFPESFPKLLNVSCFSVRSCLFFGRTSCICKRIIIVLSNFRTICTTYASAFKRNRYFLIILIFRQFQLCIIAWTIRLLTFLNMNFDSAAH